MKWWKNRSGYWMGWIVASIMGAGFSLLLAVRMFAYETFCQPGELCLREWVSALSGILAVLAAFASLAYVAKQLEQASKHHRDAMKVQLQRTRAVARRANKAAQELHNLASHFVVVWAQPGANTLSVDRSIWAFSEQMKRFLEVVSDPVFCAFEEEIDFVTPLPAAQIKEAFEAQSRSLEAHSAGFRLSEVPTRYLAQEGLGVVLQSVRYADELMRLADVFLTETDEPVRH